ncbi:polysaccharide pyruvyl transferase [Candidatus Hepatincola sp. Av]
MNIKKNNILYPSVKQLNDTFSFQLKQLSALYSENTGNIIFTTAIHKYLLHPNNKLDITYFNKDFLFSPNLDQLSDNINNNYNYVILPAANWIRKNNDVFFLRITNIIKKIKVPVIIIGLGAQSDVNYSFDFLKDQNSTQCVREFISAVYNTNGSFALRGYFTAEVFEKLGFTDYTVTGCPSLFYNGKDLTVDIPKLTEKDLKPIINGNQFLTSNHWTFCHNILYKKYSNSIFIDQDKLLPFLIEPIKNPINKTALELYIKNRLKIYGDFYPWYDFIKKNHYNFSFGSRVHGNFVSILANIPSLIHIIDSRTRELSEYFEIPTIKDKDINSPEKFDLYKLYQNLDYTNFNKNFNKKFDIMKSFFNKINLDTTLDANPSFDAHVARIKYGKHSPSFYQKLLMRKELKNLK